MQTETTVNFAAAHVPQIITKELALSTFAGRDRIRLSSNWLAMKGFEAGTRHTVELLPGSYGLRVRADAENGVQKIYQRSYSKRKNNVLETQLEISNRSVLERALPPYAERVHFEIKHSEILITPVGNRTFSIRRAIKALPDPRTAFIALTSGVDCHSFAANGFQIDGVCEYRPTESRDNTDKTETGALNVLFNSAPRVLFNEDIFRLSMDRIRQYAADAPAIGCLSLSIQCDEFSNVKAKSLKDRSLEDMNTSADMAYPALRMVEEMMPATVLIENVAGFFSSALYLQLVKPQLRRMGYFVSEQIFDAPLYDGLTLRKRGYMVASIFPGFQFPEPSSPEGRSVPVWAEIESLLADCRDVSHCKAVHDGIAMGRARHITPESLYSPTVLKSQLRQAKDSIYIAMPDGRFLLPTNEMLVRLSGFPKDLVTGHQSGEIEAEIIGQSVEYPLHDQIIKSVGEHLMAQGAKPLMVKASQVAKLTPVAHHTETGVKPQADKAIEQIPLFA